MKIALLLLPMLALNLAQAYEAKVLKGQLPPSLEALIAKANQETQLNFKTSDFYLVEDRMLATSRFQMFVQQSQEIPVARTAIRIWSDKENQELILAEMHLNEETKANETQLASKYAKARFSPRALKSKQLSLAITKMVESSVAAHDTDQRILGMKFTDQWVG